MAQEGDVFTDITEAETILNDDETTVSDGQKRRHGRDWRLFNVILLGVSFMLIFTAFQTAAMVEQTVLESVYNQTNGSFTGSGYTSLAIIYASFSVANWAAPPVIAVIGAKIAMICGGFVFLLFIVSFLKPMTWLLYTLSTFLGVGAAIIWTAQGNFLTNNSNKNTIGRNSGIFWAILQCSLLFGNLYVFFAFQTSTISAGSRVQLFIILSVTCLVGILSLFALRSTTQTPDEQHGSPPASRPRPIAAFMTSLRLLTTKDMLLLCIVFAYTGFELTFFSGVYTTCVGHTHAFGSNVKSLIGLCGIFIGIGEILGGSAFGLLGKRSTRCGRDSIVLWGFIVHLICFFLIFINLPFESPIRDTHHNGYLFTNKYVAILCAFMLGFGDSAFNTQIYSIFGQLYADDSAPAFALYKFVQSLAAAAAFFYSLTLLLQWQLLILTVFSVAGSIAFFIVDHSIGPTQPDL